MDKVNIDIKVDETIKQNKEILDLIECYQTKITKYEDKLADSIYEDEKAIFRYKIFIYENVIRDLTIVLIRCS